MSNKFNRKEILIIFGGIGTLIVMTPFILSNFGQNKSKSEKTKLDNSPKLNKLEEKQIPIQICIGEEKTEKKDKKVYIEKIKGKKSETEISLLEIPAGEFNMGPSFGEKYQLPNEKLKIGVKIEKPFYMSRYPITQEQWETVMGYNFSTFRGQRNLPVETISWDEAQTFCEKISTATTRKYRLPTEEEWEYACRAGTQTRFYFGDEIRPNQANYDTSSKYKIGNVPSGKYHGKTTRVGQYQVANSFGLEDMHGNVWEYCSDRWDPDDQGDTIYVKTKNNLGKVVSIRGGAWHSFPSRCRSAAREFIWKNVKSNRIGFRVVCEV